MFSMMSLANRLSSDALDKARSPAFPCSHTPKMAAFSGVYPCANREVRMPVRVSPLPAVAMPEFPVELMCNVPSGRDMLVYAPFKMMMMFFF